MRRRKVTLVIGASLVFHYGTELEESMQGNWRMKDEND